MHCECLNRTAPRPASIAPFSRHVIHRFSIPVLQAGTRLPTMPPAKEPPRSPLPNEASGLGNVMMVVLGSDRKLGFRRQGGPKELPEGRQLREWMGMVVETPDWGYQRRWSPWGIND